jgi:predicted nucleotidyltransferase
MDEHTRPATWEDVAHVCKLLADHGARFVLVGGYALQAHGFSRTTYDIDVAVDPAPENAGRWVLALSHLPDGAARELLDEEDPFQGDYLHAIRINDEITVDVMPSVAGITFEELERQARHVEVDGVSIPVLDLEGLLRTKQTTRLKDQADAEIIRLALDRMRR